MTDTTIAADTAPQRATFHSMDQGTQEDWNLIATEAIHNFVGLPERLMAHLRLLDGDFGGFAVDRLTHSLQTAARAERAGRDDEYVMCALIHDIGDTLGPANHADIGAAILKPFISEQNHWMMEQHGIFQGYYFFHFLGADRNLRDQFEGHEWFDYCAEFCHEYDQAAFDPAYDTPPLEHYEPLIRSICASPKRSIYKAVE
ncbi:MAG TPA: HD domain-containing protein [Microthrixaceae bacterium]|jgi:predicted HD phosphohydrolase|nr:HD domain-containing protein [Microthrixaceae bacterium]